MANANHARSTAIFSSAEQIGLVSHEVFLVLHEAKGTVVLVYSGGILFNGEPQAQTTRFNDALRLAVKLLKRLRQPNRRFVRQQRGPHCARIVVDPRPKLQHLGLRRLRLIENGLSRHEASRIAIVSHRRQTLDHCHNCQGKRTHTQRDNLQIEFPSNSWRRLPTLDFARQRRPHRFGVHAVNHHRRIIPQCQQ